ncbi:hypothetical protein AYW79_14455 [Ferroacidibacillus organovorans]|uniref:Uncharacterized protein n=1 Tax=Ferroacidibacillus organovorans TaxID=1765683 RepID=A0A162RXL5_9BACL|nr:hypothetical protein AYJ22_15075 [Ferroacidibacillus organovorans]OAG88364.1 hypothetical protein AYW79_14455 [Ferroacidibacillus organovorans]OPG14862.1 hypothetical protein B2M26_14835 [Ferroacidibacillus organovorans]
MLGERGKTGIERSAHGDFYADILHDHANRASRLTPISGSLVQHGQRKFGAQTGYINKTTNSINGIRNVRRVYVQVPSIFDAVVILGGSLPLFGYSIAYKDQGIVQRSD